MAKFKVIALSVGGKGNNVFKSGDVVTSENFNDAKALVDGGFLKEIVEPKKEVQKSTPKKSNKKGK
jgi:hypothetical protein